ncbi:SDR family NAD(P)-dependent oxidoreductase [Catellatospora sp. NPDC049609]|uniref:SDR family NAD(P)-dependent oxidoreductase n=1 Tax=Catellatospora sp. NPDC049609 TaxID=3155505 RepID=UPI0034143AB6
MEDLTRHAVITGATSGIGQAAAVALARRGWQVTVVGRDPGRLDATLGVVRAAATGPAPAGLLADFAELAQVRELAAKLSGQRIDVLANNAGLVVGKRTTTVDGHELTVQTNHLAPFLLSSLLREQLAPGARIVNTASMAHAMGSVDPDNLDRRGGLYSSWLAYGASKRANIMFAAEAARRWPELLSFSFHPGVVRTRFGTPLARLFYKIGPGLATPEQGADQLVWLATEDPARLENGAYYVLRKVTAPHPAARDPKLAARLWDATEAAVA